MGNGDTQYVIPRRIASRPNLTIGHSLLAVGYSVSMATRSLFGRRLTVILIAASFAVAPLAHKAECATSEMDLQDCIRYATEHSPALQKLEVAHHTKQLSTLIKKADFDIGLSASVERDDSGDELPASLSLSKEIVGGIDVTASRLLFPSITNIG